MTSLPFGTATHCAPLHASDDPPLRHAHDARLSISYDYLTASPMAPRSRIALTLLAIALGAAGAFAFVFSVQNNPLEGWGMVLRALGGHALWLGAGEATARAVLGRPSTQARLFAALVASLVLTPVAAFVVLLTKESGPGWTLPAILLFAWFAATGAAAFVMLLRSLEA